ncbi:flippase-like domain-containing protein [Phormidium tenue FACHB-886]|nr:flippase-like domain-containing protein [Phormidium tenue FACHB-886]
MTAKSFFSRLKPYLRWVILGSILFFLVSALKQHWQEIAAIRISARGYIHLAAGFGMTLIAHVWSGWIWSWILHELGQPVRGLWSVLVYLKTNIAKYLPGNIWQFYGRIVAARHAGFSIAPVTLSVLLEPLLMAAAALAIALLGIQQGNWGWQLLVLCAVLVGIHPRILNPLLGIVSRLKKSQNAVEGFHLKRYPLLPLLGEAGFVLLRGIGFLLTLAALSPIAPAQIPFLISAFSFAWMLGLIVPGAPGGIGIFEATALALLRNQFPPGIILGGVALYRLTSILVEAIGAGAAYAIEKTVPIQARASFPQKNAED